ncbi:MAG: phage scaffolding protein [Clostridia bacterium]|nr:phage scaffolding protein [Clostridia bacterium]
MNRDELLSLGVGEDICDRILENVDLIKSEYERKIEDLRKENMLDIALYESGARNIKAVKALIDTQGDVNEQIERLKSEKETSFLFENMRRSFKPGKSSEKLPDAMKNDFEVRLGEARKRGNTIEAIRIKQQAAAEGVILA